MKLGELIDALKAFDCPVLRDMEVSHYFVDKSLYAYREDVKGVSFDTEGRRIVLTCENPIQTMWYDKNLLKP